MNQNFLQKNDIFNLELSLLLFFSMIKGLLHAAALTAGHKVCRAHHITDQQLAPAHSGDDCFLENGIK